MNDTVRRALVTDRVIDITTIGRKSGLPRRIETWFYRAGDDFVLTGTPGTRDWYANLLANPEFTFHLKQSHSADLAARAEPVTAPDARREILIQVLRDLGQSRDIEAWLASSPIMRVTFLESDG